MLESTGSHERGRTEDAGDEPDGRVQLHIDLTCVSRMGRSTLLLYSKAPEQMTAGGTG